MATFKKMCHRRIFFLTLRRQFVTILVSMSTMLVILMMYQYSLRDEYTDMTYKIVYDNNVRSAKLLAENGRLGNSLEENDHSVKLREGIEYMVINKNEQVPELNKEMNEISPDTNETKQINKLHNVPLEGAITQAYLNDPMEEIVRQHFQIGDTIKFDYQHSYIINGSSICRNNQPPFMLIMCLSNPGEHSTRYAIRNTWGSIARTGRWPRRENNYTSEVKIVFLIGKPWTREVGKRIARESAVYNDVVMSKFEDKYSNLTRKVMIGLRWAKEFCPGSTFIMKTDSDTFVNVDNAINYVKNVRTGDSGVIIGSMIAKGTPFRKGKWAILEELYPFSRFPYYTSGQTYIMSSDLALKIVNTAQYFSYVRIEDVFITGIMRIVLGGKLIKRDDAFPLHARMNPSICEFFGTNKISETNINDEKKYIIWDLLQKPRHWCRYKD